MLFDLYIMGVHHYGADGLSECVTAVSGLVLSGVCCGGGDIIYPAGVSGVRYFNPRGTAPQEQESQTAEKQMSGGGTV